jgi:hypothetical protein
MIWVLIWLGNVQKKEAKRLALARVDENVCRSIPRKGAGQQRNLNLQQH